MQRLASTTEGGNFLRNKEEKVSEALRTDPGNAASSPCLDLSGEEEEGKAGAVEGRTEGSCSCLLWDPLFSIWMGLQEILRGEKIADFVSRCAGRCSAYLC